MSARSRDHLSVLVYDNAFDGVTRHACLCEVNKRIECGNASAMVLCSLCTVPCRPLSGPHGCTRKFTTDCVTFLLVGWRSLLS